METFVPKPEWLDDMIGIKFAPRILIAGTSFIDNEHSLALFDMWFRVIKTLNPNEDFVLVDACSPFDPRLHVPKDTNVFRWDENVGAITRGGKDGCGRSMCKVIELAIEGNYDYIAICESDAIFCQPVRPIINRMHKAGVKAASIGLASPYLFAEWSTVFLNVKYLKDMKFIERYDWEHSQPWPLIEMRLEKMFGDDLFFLNYRGFRNEGNQLNISNLANNYPYGNAQWLTHAADLNLYARMLELNNIYPV